MSDEQLDETSISQGHSTFGICGGMCMFMCECEESDFEISNQNQCLQVFGLVALAQGERNTELTVNSDAVKSDTHGSVATGHVTC